jgi:ABC-type multidrug transport system permease subunit
LLFLSSFVLLLLSILGFLGFLEFRFSALGFYLLQKSLLSFLSNFLLVSRENSLFEHPSGEYLEHASTFLHSLLLGQLVLAATLSMGLGRYHRGVRVYLFLLILLVLAIIIVFFLILFFVVFVFFRRSMVVRIGVCPVGVTVTS